MTAGAIHRLGRMVSLFEGIGYGRTATAWELAESEGGGLALNDGLTHKGLAAELGVMLVVRTDKRVGICRNHSRTPVAGLHRCRH